MSPSGLSFSVLKSRPFRLLLLARMFSLSALQAQGAQHHLGHGRPAGEAGQIEAQDGGADQAVHQFVARYVSTA